MSVQRLSLCNLNKSRRKDSRLFVAASTLLVSANAQREASRVRAARPFCALSELILESITESTEAAPDAVALDVDAITKTVAKMATIIDLKIFLEVFFMFISSLLLWKLPHGSWLSITGPCSFASLPYDKFAHYVVFLHTTIKSILRLVRFTILFVTKR